MNLQCLLEELTKNATQSDIACLLPFLALLALSTSSIATDSPKAVSCTEKFMLALQELSSFLAWLAVLTALIFIFLSLKIFVTLSWLFALTAVCIVVMLFTPYFVISTLGHFQRIRTTIIVFREALLDVFLPKEE